MFNHVKDIRDLDVAELAQVLGTKVAEMEDGFDKVSNLGLHQRTEIRSSTCSLESRHGWKGNAAAR